MANAPRNADEIFLAANAITDPAERGKFLEAACAGDELLRQQVEPLLHAHAPTKEAPEPIAPSLAPTLIGDSRGERSSVLIGPYKLLEQIGEGGMGVVYMAEQKEPVERRVALKIIKPGMDSRQIVARFEAERQALALMDHPNIARVFDGGTTNTGLPYFVMELVKGVPLTQFCDERRLTPRQRLELFIPVCAAVQHAHQKGIIHRDLKPSNVLVALYDGNPVPKVIDFGVAKATGAKLTEQTMFTSFGNVVGTVQYMSPEQAQMNQLDIDTRSDIYSLGVLLYELLTGTTPLERKRVKEAAILELLRLVREEEPPKPSTRLSTLEGLPSIAANRGLEPRKLSGQVRGELDWIVMKALEKNRTRRYETANGLAMDLHRYLADEAVLAGPPSASYRVRKFIYRNRRAVLALACFFVLLTAGLIGTVWGFVRAHEAAVKEAAQQELAQVEKERARQFALFVGRLFRSADEFGFRGAGFRRVQEPAKDLTVVELVKRAAQSVNDEFADYPTTRADLLTMLGEVDRSQGQYEEAEKLLSKARDLYQEHRDADPLKVGENLYALASVLGDKWDYERSIPLFKEALNRLADDSTPEGPKTRIQVKIHLGFALLGQSRDAKAEEVFREAIADCQGKEKELSFELSMAHTGLVSALLAQGKDAKAQEQFVEHLVAENPNVISQGIVAYRQITAHLAAHRFAAALEKAQELLKLTERQVGADHPVYALVLGVMADVQKKMGDYRGAEASIRKSLEIGGKWVVDHPKLWEPMQELAKFLQGRGDFDEARQFYLKSLHIVTKRFSPSDPRFIGPAIGLHALLGRLARDRGDYPGAEAEFAAALDLVTARMPHDPGMVMARAELLRDDGTAQMESGHLQTAFGRLQESRELYRSANRPDELLEVQSTLIELHRLLGDYATANDEWKSLHADLDAQCRNFRIHPERADWRAYGAFLKLHEYALAAQTMAAYVDGVRHNPDADPMELPDRLYKQGGLLVRVQEYGKAIRVLRESLASYERSLGRDHSQCGDVMLELARADAGSGAKDMAESLAREACSLRENRLGREHLWTAKARAELAGILGRDGKHKEAASILAETLKLRIARLPAAHPDIWRNQLELADSLQASNDQRAAVVLLRRSVQALADALPPKSYRVAALESDLAASLTKLGEFAEAERLLLSAYARQNEDVSDLVEGRQASRQRLAELYQAWGKPSEATKYTTP